MGHAQPIQIVANPPILAATNIQGLQPITMLPGPQLPPAQVSRVIEEGYMKNFSDFLFPLDDVVSMLSVGSLFFVVMYCCWLVHYAELWWLFPILSLGQLQYRVDYFCNKILSAFCTNAIVSIWILRLLSAVSFVLFLVYILFFTVFAFLSVCD